MPYRDKATRNARARARRRGAPNYVPPALEERFWAKVDKNGPVPTGRPILGPCWIWTAGYRGAGYGRIRGIDSVTISAHRLALGWAIGRPLTDDEMACHHCDNPPCVNNEGHLFLGDNTVNVADRMAKGRHRYRGRTRATCACGVTLTPENRCGRRAQCRPCANAQQRVQRAVRARARRARGSRRDRQPVDEGGGELLGPDGGG